MNENNEKKPNKPKKGFNLEAYKSTIKVADTPLKEDSFLVLDPCLQPLFGMPGLPMGHITQVFGKSDSGKSSLLFHAAAQAQKQNILPVIIVTEGKVDWGRAQAMGFDRSSAIIEENIEYLEGGFSFIDRIVSDVIMGELPQDVFIFWDSIGNTLSEEEVVVNADGTTERKSTMMKAAKVIKGNLRVISHKINNTRKISSPKNVGLCFINQAYTAPPAFPGAPSALVPYGGDGIWFASTLVLRTSRSQKLKAKKNGQDLGFGIVTKISVDKNHLTPTSNAGDFVITADRIFANEKGEIAAYKEEKKETWGEDLFIFNEDNGLVLGE